MYKQVETDKSATLKNGAEFVPIATLENDSGGRCQIAIDDGCYILYLKREGGYVHTAWIFPEAFKVLKSLPIINTNITEETPLTLKNAVEWAKFGKKKYLKVYRQYYGKYLGNLPDEYISIPMIYDQILEGREDWLMSYLGQTTEEFLSIFIYSDRGGETREREYNIPNWKISYYEDRLSKATSEQQVRAIEREIDKINRNFPNRLDNLI